jgi:Tol biopolymer transport system component
VKALRILIIAWSLISIVAACGRDGADEPPRQEPSSASLPAAALRVTDQREVTLERGTLLSLSPDGRWLAVIESDSLSLYDTESLSRRAAVTLESVSPALGSFAWSPDSAHLAFSDDVMRLMVESDLWVLDAESGELTDLTDDGIAGSAIDPEPAGAEPLLDAAPAWSSDGSTLLFSRTPMLADGRRRTDLYRISVRGGEAKMVLTVDEQDPLVVWHGLKWVSDQDKILFSIYGQQPDDPQNGIWVAKQNATGARQLIGPDPEMGPPLLIDVAASGDTALIQYVMIAEMQPSQPNVSYFHLLDLESGATVPLKQSANIVGIDFFSPFVAAFSPDGSKILYSYRTYDAGFRLVVRDVDGDLENVLLTTQEPMGFQPDVGLGLNWASDDTIFIATSPSTGLLLQVAGE